jgi:outer membrane protein assembly factor BamE
MALVLLPAALAALVGGWPLRSKRPTASSGVITPYRYRHRAGQRRHQGAGRAHPARHDAPAGADRARLADADRPFHADRWDYLFTIRRQGAEPQRRSVVAHFEGNVLKKLDAPTSCRRERVRRLHQPPPQGPTAPRSWN